MVESQVVQARVAADQTLVLQRMLVDQQSVPATPTQQPEKERLLDGHNVAAIIGWAGVNSPSLVPHIWSMWQAMVNIRMQHSDLTCGINTWVERKEQKIDTPS